MTVPESPTGRLAALFWSPQAPDRFNRAFIFLAFVSLAVFGSATTVLVLFYAVSAILMIVLRRVPLTLRRSDAPIVGASLLFVAVMGLTTLLGDPAPDSGARLLDLVPFALLPFLVSGFRQSPPDALIGEAFSGACLGGALLLAVIVVEYTFFSDRVAGFAGNSGPFSITCLLVVGLSGLALGRPASRLFGRSTELAIAAILGGTAGVFLSGMRGSWPALFVVLAVVALARQGSGKVRDEPGRRRTLVLVAVGAVVLAPFFALAVVPEMSERVSLLFDDISRINVGAGDETSTGLRLSMWGAAASAFAEAPILGHGLGNVWPAVSDAPGLQGIEFTHLHNAVLTVAVAAGILGVAALFLMVAAPLATGWRARRDPQGRVRLAFSAIVAVSFFIPGMTNVMFFHDILDGAWVLLTAVLAASVPDGGRH